MNSWSLKETAKKLLGKSSTNFHWGLDSTPELRTDSNCYLKGWVFGTNNSAWLEVFVEQEKICSIECTEIRSDVYNFHPTVTQSLCSGFNIDFGKNYLAKLSSHALRVDAVTLNARETIWSKIPTQSAESSGTTGELASFKSHLQSLYLKDSSVQIKKSLSKSSKSKLLNVVIDLKGSKLSLVNLLKELHNKAKNIRFGTLFIIHSDYEKDSIENIVQHYSIFKDCKLIRSFTECSGADGLIFYIDDQVNLELLDLENFISDYIKSENALFYSPIVFNSNILPPIRNLKELSKDLNTRKSNFEIALYNKYCFLTSAEALKYIYSTITFPNPKPGLSFHSALSHTIYLYTSDTYSAVNNLNQLKLFFDNYPWRKITADTSTLLKYVYLVISDEPGIGQSARGYGFWINSLLQNLEQSGLVPVLIYDDQHLGTERKQFGSYVAYSLADVDKVFSGSWARGLVLALSWRGIATAKLIGILSDSKIALIQSELGSLQWQNTAYDLAEKASLTEKLELASCALDCGLDENLVKFPIQLNYELLKPSSSSTQDIVIIYSADGYGSNLASTLDFFKELKFRFDVNTVTILSASKSSLPQEISALGFKHINCQSDFDLIEYVSKAKILIDCREKNYINFLAYEAISLGLEVFYFGHNPIDIEFTKSIIKSFDLNEIGNMLNAVRACLTSSLSQTIPKFESKSWAKDLINNLNQTANDIESKSQQKIGTLRSISVIVPVSGCLSELVQFTRSLMLGLPEDTEVVFVNDTNSSVISSWLRNVSKVNTRFKLLENEKPVGFVLSSLEGFKASRLNTDILVLNPNVILGETVITDLQSACYFNYRQGLAVPNVVTSNREPKNLNPGDSFFDLNKYLKGQYPKVSNLSVGTNCKLLFIRRDIIDEFGFLDPVINNENNWDREYILKLLNLGFETREVTSALVSSVTDIDLGTDFKNDRVLNLRYARYRSFINSIITKEPNSVESLKTYHLKSEKLSSPEINYQLEDSLENIEQDLLNINSTGTIARVLKSAEVVFVLPSVLLGGGSLSVLQHVQEMQQRGVNAKIISLTSRVEPHYNLLSGIIPVTTEQFFNLDWSNQRVVATFWLTAFYVKRLCELKPNLTGFYYIQDYEPWFYKNTDKFYLSNLVEKTYSLGLQSVAKTQYLVDQVKKYHNVDVIKITPGLDRTVFYSGEQLSNLGRPRLAGLYKNNVSYRGGSLMLEVLEEVLYRLPELEVNLFGDKPSADFRELPINFIGAINQNEVANLYRNSEIVLDLSEFHGFGRMGIEGMTCGAVPILSRSGGVTEYAINEDNALLVDVGDKDSAVSAIIKLCKDSEYREKLRRSGLASASRFSEGLAVDDWLNIFALPLTRVSNPIDHLLEPGVIRVVRGDRIVA